MYSPSQSGSQWVDEEDRPEASHPPQPFTPNDLNLVNQRLADLGLRAGPYAMPHLQGPPSGAGTYQPRRTGGTNVDPGSVRSESGDEGYVDNWRGTVHQGRAQSTRSHDRCTTASDWDVSRGSVASDQDSVERMTVGGATSIWTTRGVETDMLAMRERLQADADAAEDLHDRELRDQLVKTTKLSSTVHRLHDAEAQMRHLQATLIAEQVGRTQAEKRSETERDEVKKYKNELAGAVRALRRAREEAKRGEEERRRVLRGWDEAKERLHRYHEELKVRDARAKGKEEGRQEAFIEIERWMTSPPIPVEPVTDPANILSASPHNRLNQLAPQQNQQDMMQSPGRQRTPAPQQMYAQQRPTPRQTPQSLHQMQQPQPQMQQPQQQQQQYAQQQPQQHIQGPPQPQFQSPSPAHFAAPPSAHQAHSQGGAVLQGRPMSRQEHPGAYAQEMRHGTPPEIHQSQATALPQGHHGPPPKRDHPSTALYPPTEPHFYNAADSYLDHVEHDPQLQSMLQGAPTRTFHTSYGQTEQSRPQESGGRSRSHSQSQHERRPATRTTGYGGGVQDKPLPDLREGSVPMPMPMLQQMQQQHQQHSGSDVHRAQSTVPRRDSLQGQLKHSRSMSQIPDGDRYPVFPRPGGVGHSRQSSRDQTYPQHPSQPPSMAHRSRLAGGLRSDLDLGEPDLDRIEEEHHQQPRRAGTMYEGGNSGEAQRHHRARSQLSMPSLRQRPVPKMPVPLSHNPRETDEREPNRRSLLGPSGLGGRQPAPSGPTSRNSHRGSPLPPANPTPQPPASRQTLIVTERFDPQPSPHDIPLPQSRTTTMYSAAPQRRDISIIDYAMQRPLPDSRPQTFLSVAGRAATVETETDAEAPRHSRPQTRQSRRQGPRSVASRRPKGKASSTVATIDEITEEESGVDRR